jgi:glycosyltransferase involved in cell wall biosynthesis
MNIIIFLTYGVSFKNWDEAGLLSRELKLYKKLQEKYNFKFTFVTYGDESDLNYKEHITNMEVIPIYKFNKQYNNKILSIFQSLTIPMTLKKLTNNKYDIIKTNQLLGSWVAIIYKIIIRKPLIIRTGYDLYLFSRKDGKNFIKQGLYYFLTLAALNFSTIYTVTSKSDFKYIEKHYFFKKDKLLIRRNWVDLIESNSLQVAGANKVLAVGRLEPQKDFSTLVKIFNNSNIELDIIGEGSLENELKSITKKNIQILERVSNSELIELYSKYKIFISFSNYEGNPKTTLEAMGSGCLVIALDIPNNSEIIEHGVTGILIKSKDSSVLNILESFFENNNEFNRITTNAKNYIIKSHSLEGYLNTEIEDYRALSNFN